MRVVDYGRIAATFVNVKTEVAVRIAPRHDIRQRALTYAPHEKRRYFAMLHAYQVMPLDVLFSVAPVALSINLREIISRPGVRVNCSRCGEEVINERERQIDGKPVCRACVESSYYLPL